MYNSDHFLNFGAPNSFEWQHLFVEFKLLKTLFFMHILHLFIHLNNKRSLLGCCNVAEDEKNPQKMHYFTMADYMYEKCTL